MLFKGLICVGGIVEAIEPKRINDKTHFKIYDHGNLQYFPVGSMVCFSLILNPSSGTKLASIEAIHEEGRSIDNDSLPPVIDLTLFKQESKRGKVAEIKAPLHFYLVFNPMFNTKIKEDMEGATQAHSFYNLLQQKSKNDQNAYLYWGKLKSTDGNDPLHKEHFIQVLESNTSFGVATNLYISDFHFFWCAKVSNVEFMLDYDKQKGNTLNFYNQNWDRIEAWFKITDMKLLSNNPKETNELISKLVISPKNKLNSRQDESQTLSVTPYLSGLRYPLIIEDSKEEVYFGLNQLEKSVLEENVLLEKSESETKRTKTMIYSYAIPEEIFSKFSHQVQNEILWAELEYMKCEARTKHDLYTTDFRVARNYLIALERVLNDIIRASNPPAGSRLFRPGEIMSLGYLYTVISENQHAYMTNKFFQLYEYLNWLKSSLLKWSKIRNEELVHLGESQMSSESLKNIRRVLLGVGINGVLAELYKATFPQLRNLHDIDIPPKEMRAKSS